MRPVAEYTSVAAELNGCVESYIASPVVYLIVIVTGVLLSFYYHGFCAVLFEVSLFCM